MSRHSTLDCRSSVRTEVLTCFCRVVKRPITTEDGLEVGMEEYFDYIFPDEAAAAPNLKLLEAAQRWKRQKVMENSASA